MPLSEPSRVLRHERGGVACASHHGEAWRWGHQRSPETRLRDAGRRLRSRPESSCVARGRQEGARVPLGVHTVLPHDRPGTVLPLSWYRQSRCVRAIAA